MYTFYIGVTSVGDGPVRLQDGELIYCLVVNMTGQCMLDVCRVVNTTTGQANSWLISCFSLGCSMYCDWCKIND